MARSSSYHRVKQLILTNSVFYDTKDDADTFHQTSEPIPDHTFEPASERIPEPTRKEGPTIALYSEKLKLVGLDLVDSLFLAAFHIF
ncbi:hypothetical protein E3N88_14098 [Mikania micrantha]|uniref:Uncharacterized protein n=1 Tax=Mikania micrantha TaxID=192012 RepID=A0A5N6P1S1_9ASTR|nr:hypothetical protein E3N88_14098 [Mikania micrantha]